MNRQRGAALFIALSILLIVTLITLTANVINSRGLRNQARSQMSTAKNDYHKAFLVNPEYANAFNNRGNIRFGDEDLEDAIADYTEAIRLSPGFCEAYCNRGMAKHRLGRYDEARRDYHLAMSNNSDYADARASLQVLDAVDHPKPPAGKDSSRSPDGFHSTAPRSSRASIKLSENEEVFLAILTKIPQRQWSSR